MAPEPRSWSRNKLYFNMDFYTLGTGIYLCTGIIFIKIFVNPMLFVSHQSTGTFFLLLLTMKESYVFSGVINKKKFFKISQPICQMSNHLCHKVRLHYIKGS